MTTKKKRSPRKVIESTFPPEVEHAFVKSQGREIEDLTNYSSTETQSNQSPVEGRKNYTHIHTHPSALPIKVKHKAPIQNLSFWEEILYRLFPRIFETELVTGYKEIDYSATPSGKDMELFLKEKNEKTMVIAVREPNTGRVRGYTILRKTEVTPKIVNAIGVDVEEYRKAVRGPNRDTESFSALQSFTEKYHLNYRFLAAEDYKINEGKTQFVRKRLEHKVAATIAIIGFFGGALFLSSNITGNFIGNLSQAPSNIIGAVLFIVALIGAFLFFKKR